MHEQFLLDASSGLNYHDDGDYCGGGDDVVEEEDDGDDETCLKSTFITYVNMNYLHIFLKKITGETEL